MNDSVAKIHFEGTSGADADRYAASLMQALREAHNEVQVEREEPDPFTMDFGGTLV